MGGEGGAAVEVGVEGEVIMVLARRLDRVAVVGLVVVVVMVVMVPTGDPVGMEEMEGMLDMVVLVLSNPQILAF
jgi:hypothetical protein